MVITLDAVTSSVVHIDNSHLTHHRESLSTLFIIFLTAAAGSLVPVIEVVFPRWSLPSEPRLKHFEHFILEWEASLKKSKQKRKSGNLFERPAKESSDPKLVDWVGDTTPGLDFR